jgi:hypothetical protein
MYDASNTDRYPNGLLNTNPTGANTCVWGRLSSVSTHVARQKNAPTRSAQNVFLLKDSPAGTLLTIDYGRAYNTDGYVPLYCVPREPARRWSVSGLPGRGAETHDSETHDSEKPVEGGEDDGSQTSGPNAPRAKRYCLCRKRDDGTLPMIGCSSGSKCPHGGWFHLHCLGMDHRPLGRWACPACRAAAKKKKRDRPPAGRRAGSKRKANAPAAARSVHRHPLQLDFGAARARSCDLCTVDIAKGDAAYRCRECDWDCCGPCFLAKSGGAPSHRLKRQRTSVDRLKVG